jgi:O-acetyl-ADP-ribose deacetylase (regulator of RNase III)
MASRIRVVQGDITREAVDAIVNAANAALAGGGGVDGAIHRAAGPALMDACRTIGGCPAGEARITPGFALPARFVIHAVGPIWQGGGANEDALLASCHTHALALARAAGARRIAFPAISTGVYRFPVERAASIAVGTVARTIAGDTRFESVRFVCFNAPVREAFDAALARVSPD